MQNWLPFTLTLSFCMTFRTFSAALLCPKMYPSFVHESKLLTILFLRCLLVHLPFAETMPIIFAEGIKRLGTPLRDLVTFMRVGEMGRIWITSDLQPLVPVQIARQLSFAIVRSRRGPKRKLLG